MALPAGRNLYCEIKNRFCNEFSRWNRLTRATSRSLRTSRVNRYCGITAKERRFSTHITLEWSFKSRIYTWKIRWWPWRIESPRKGSESAVFYDLCGVFLRERNNPEFDYARSSRRMFALNDRKQAKFLLFRGAADSDGLEFRFVRS